MNILDNMALEVITHKLKEHHSEPSNKIPSEEIEFLEKLFSYMTNLDKLLKDTSNQPTWEVFSTFWPPICVESAKERQACIFFGAGMSFPCGIPTWNKLLRDHFQLDDGVLNDPNLSNDPLTMAQLASEQIGSEILQDVLRRIMTNKDNRYPFSINHMLIAALRSPVYITTNYDTLFEAAWKKVNPMITLITVTTSADLEKVEVKEAIESKMPILYKIHGCVDRDNEQMILTRRDYRLHYRANIDLFKQVREYLKSLPTIFLGFSHKDPEVSRLVEDIIYEYEMQEQEHENQQIKEKDEQILRIPRLFSLQFDMNEHTPEIFAAKGIVALHPPTAIKYLDLDKNSKTASLALALIDIIGSIEHSELYENIKLDDNLQAIQIRLETALHESMDLLESVESDAIEFLKSRSNIQWLTEITEKCVLATQGIYLLDDNGNVVAFELPDGLSKDHRAMKNLGQRPYFRQAKSFRESFVSDSLKSIFNQQCTFFLCNPLTDHQNQMVGLLFAACQIGQGQWREPIEMAKEYWKPRFTFLLIDSNGICLVPQDGQLDEFDRPVSDEEKMEKNSGYLYEELKRFSLRDTLVRHISKNVIPIAQDDDVLFVPPDLQQYTVVTKIRKTRWKLGISLTRKTDMTSL